MSNPAEDINQWAEKLQQVTLPGDSQSWRQMETLLDKEMPLVKNNNLRRWLLLVILLLLLIGVCNCPGIMTTNRAIPKNGEPVASGPVSETKQVISSRIKDLDSSGRKNGNQPGGNNKIEITEPEKPVAVKTAADNKYKTGTGLSSFHISKNIHGFYPKKNNKKHPSDAYKKLYGQHFVASEGNNPIKKDSSKNYKTALKGTDEISLQDSFPSYRGSSEVKINAATLSRDSEKKTAKKTDSLLKKQQDITHKKGVKTDSVQESKGFLLALGLNQYFPVGNQEKSNYNSSGTSGGIGDYIPVPVARYYFHNWFYVQAEVQFNTPQYTKTLLANVSGADTLQSVFIKKLFYFNIPISAHYSPFKNVYIGGGLQYSRLTNGVALFQDAKPGGQSTIVLQPSETFFISTKIAGFKSTTAYDELKTSELRFLFDLNYQYKPLTLGLRYNQAFSRFINVHISSTIITQAHNVSLQLYLRYTLWDHRKKYLIPKQ